jgi:hypothetical protein
LAQNQLCRKQDEIMDEIVKQAMAKWPNVPHCFGWLALDGRGAWRMRDERVQKLGLSGDRINHPALKSFIDRNYVQDAHGCWYFQNGPQRVYVDLLATPFIAHTDPMQGFVLHTGEPVAMLDECWMTDDGHLIIEGNGKVAQLDDRDMSEAVAQFRIGGVAVSDDRLLEWLDNPSDNARLTYETPSRQVPIQRLPAADVPARFKFIRTPKPEQALQT